MNKQSLVQIPLLRSMVLMMRNCILEESKEPRAGDCQENYREGIFSSLRLHTLYRWHLLSTAGEFARIGLPQGNLAV